MKNYALLNGSYTDETLYNIELNRAEGDYIYDNLNKPYLDLRSGLWNTSIGYNRELYEKVMEEFNKVFQRNLPYVDIHSFYHESYDSLASKILDITNHDFERVIYTNSGSENTELSLKISSYINKKGKVCNILAFNNSYHGSFFGGVSVSGIDQEINELFHPKYGNVTFIDFPKTVESEQTILDLVADKSKQYDVMFIEPVLASAGVYFATPDFFNKLIKILKSNNVLVVFDEVATGFFKTGKVFYYQHLSEYPDILCLSKSINNGINPVGCVCVNNYVDNKLRKNNIVKEHFSTQNGNILGMKSAEVTLDYYISNKEMICKNVNDISSLINKILDMKKIPYRNIGLMTSIKTNDGEAVKFLKNLLGLGILVYLYNSGGEEGITIIPSFNINKERLSRSIDIIAKKHIKF